MSKFYINGFLHCEKEIPENHYRYVENVQFETGPPYQLTFDAKVIQHSNGEREIVYCADDKNITKDIATGNLKLREIPVEDRAYQIDGPERDAYNPSVGTNTNGYYWSPNYNITTGNLTATQSNIMAETVQRTQENMREQIERQLWEPTPF